MNGDNWGGKRPGAGRPKGSENKATVGVRELLERIGCDPIEGMARVAMNDTEALGLADGETIPITLRAKMYSELAPYVAPKRRATELTIDRGEGQEVIMQLPPDLAQVLAERRGETIEDIDTTYKVIEGEVT